MHGPLLQVFIYPVAVVMIIALAFGDPSVAHPHTPTVNFCAA